MWRFYSPYSVVVCESTIHCRNRFFCTVRPLHSKTAASLVCISHFSLFFFPTPPSLRFQDLLLTREFPALCLSMSFFFRRFFSATSPATMDAAQKKAQQLIDDNAVMVFSKSYCPYCNNTKRLLDSYNAKYKAIELNQEDDGDDIQAALAKITGQRTVPNIFINKQHIGGNSDLEAVASKGKDGKKLEELLKEAGAL